jgi:hypothetical protein
MSQLFSTSVPSNAILTYLEPFAIEDLAVETGFVKRDPIKIEPRAFVASVLQTVFQGGLLRNIATKNGFLIDDTISAQAVDKRFTAGFTKLLEKLLFQSLLHRSEFKLHSHVTNHLFRYFPHVLIQDSTTIALARKLLAAFPGPKNKYGQSATARIQIIMDLLNEQFYDFKVTPFTRNDQSAAADILRIAQPGDLVLRDLGYFKLAVFRQMVERGIYFLSRLKYGVALFEADSKTRINLLERLQEQSALDMFVYAGVDDMVPGRLVAQPVPEEIAEQRRKEAREDRDERLNHNDEYMRLLGWQIYFTTIPRAWWTPKDVCQGNGFRWRIEIVIKGWKSHFKLEDVPNVNEEHGQAHIYAALLMITLFQNNLYLKIVQAVKEHNKNNANTEISLLKLTKFFKENDWILSVAPQDQKIQDRVMKQILYHCRYQIRTRKDYPTKFQEFR